MPLGKEEELLFGKMRAYIGLYHSDDEEMVQFCEDLIHDITQVYTYKDISSEEDTGLSAHVNDLKMMLIYEKKKLLRVKEDLVGKKSSYISQVIEEKKKAKEIKNEPDQRKRKSLYTAANSTISSIDVLIEYEYERVGYVQRRINEIDEFIFEIQNRY